MIQHSDLTKLVGENEHVKKGVQYLSVTITVLGMITVGVGAWYVYRNNFWKPKVKIDSLDFPNGNAKVTVSNMIIKPNKELQGNSTISISGDWGLRFGSENTPDGKTKFDRLELVKNGLVHGTIYAPTSPNNPQNKPTTNP